MVAPLIKVLWHMKRYTEYLSLLKLKVTVILAVLIMILSACWICRAHFAILLVQMTSHSMEIVCYQC